MKPIYHGTLLALGIAVALSMPDVASFAAQADGGGQPASKPPASSPPRTTPQRDRVHDPAVQKDRLKDQDRDRDKDQDRDRDQDRDKDQDRDRDQDRSRDALQSGEQVFGWQLMTEAERNSYREQMRSLRTEQERERFRETHHQQMLERAKAQGVTLPPEPRPQQDR